MKSISTSLTDTLKDSDLKGITTEWSEVFLDTFLADGVLKDIPIINSIIGIGKTGFRINEMMFYRKIFYFISQINEIQSDERDKFISEIDDSKKYRINVGEKLLYIIDKCDDHEKAEITGKLFSVFLRGLIDYDEFLRCALVIEKCMVNDLKWFIRSTSNSYEMRDGAELLNWGLLEFAPLDLKIQQKRNGNTGFEITDKKLKLKLSEVGETIRSCLREYLNEKLKELKLREIDLNDLEKYISSLIKDYEKDNNRERIESNLIDFICEVCNNHILNEVEIKIIFTHVMELSGYYTIRSKTREVQLKFEEVTKSGNEFNLDRWMKFSDEFIDEHDLRNFRGERL